MNRDYLAGEAWQHAAGVNQARTIYLPGRYFHTQKASRDSEKYLLMSWGGMPSYTADKPLNDLLLQFCVRQISHNRCLKI